MPIPESQLKAWAEQGPVAPAQSALESLRETLFGDVRSLVHDHATDFFMRGSYGNGTNTSGQVPVDAAVVLTSAWSQDLATGGTSPSDLSRLQTASREFRLDVLGTLRAKHGLAGVEDLSDGLLLAGAEGRLPIRLQVGIQHRLYLSFGVVSGKQYQEGLCFWTPDGQQVVRFPKLHHENGQAKDGESGAKGWFKPLVRVFKSARDHLARGQAIDPALAPSYFLECLVYNIPDQFFGWSLADSLAGALKWLGSAQLSGLRAQNGIDPLFGSGLGRWSDDHARLSLSALARAWTEWPPAAQ
ncbi:MAG: hypothetical protein HY926_11730 [Elusimicrobia bacterium]|nr:hypothetical protein [Elusimicrobiota bacterium]